MKVNGESINADYLSFNVFNDGTARLALDHDKGAFLIKYDYRKTPADERDNMLCEPVALEFTGDGKGKAIFKEGWRVDSDTGARTWARPFIPCRVEKVPYNAEERKQYERNMRQREAQKNMLEEEKQRAEKAREQAELDRDYKTAFIESRKQRDTFRGIRIVEDGKSLLVNGVPCAFDGPKRWEIVRLLTTTTNPDGWATIPSGSRALSCFKGNVDAERFRQIIEPESAGSGNKGKRFRIIALG